MMSTQASITGKEGLSINSFNCLANVEEILIEKGFTIEKIYPRWKDRKVQGMIYIPTDGSPKRVGYNWKLSDSDKREVLRHELWHYAQYLALPDEEKQKPFFRTCNQSYGDERSDTPADVYLRDLVPDSMRNPADELYRDLSRKFDMGDKKDFYDAFFGLPKTFSKK